MVGQNAALYSIFKYFNNGRFSTMYYFIVIILDSLVNFVWGILVLFKPFRLPTGSYKMNTAHTTHVFIIIRILMGNYGKVT